MLENCRDNLIAVMKERIDPAFILVFGSYSSGTENEGSDLDIAYYAAKEFSDYERFIVAGELSSVCNGDVDLVDIRKADTVFAAQIFFTGELLYSKNDQLFFKEWMKAGSMYVTLNEQRAEVLRIIEERGSVYGK